MELINGTLQVMKGEQYTTRIGGIDYDLCEQIVLVLYKESVGVVSKAWVKVPDAKYPNAGLITKSDDLNLQLEIFVKVDVPTGKYFLEAERIIDGINAPILKNKKEFFTVTESRT